MDNRYFENVIKEMQPFFDEQGFATTEEEGVFKSEKCTAKISYSEERQMYLLSVLGEEGEYAEVSSWLFDDSQNAKDAESVGVDFTETLREKIGVKRTRSSASAASIDLPTASKGDSMNIAAFTKKVLDVYPQYKDEYRAHVAKYGNFLYLEFFSTTLVVQIGSTLAEGNKKSVKKLFEMLQNAYIHGDKETVNAVVACVAAAAVKDNGLLPAVEAMLAEDSHFLSGVKSFIPVLKGNKKLCAALLK